MTEENSINSTPSITQNESNKQEDTKMPLKDCIATLERVQGPLEEMSQEAAEWLDEAENKMRDTAELIRQNFQTIRDAIDKKEEEMIEQLDKYTADLDATKDLIENARDLALEIPAILEGGKALLNRNNEEGKEEE